MSPSPVMAGLDPAIPVLFAASTTVSVPEVLTNSRDIKRRLEKDGWVVERVGGSHHVLKHPVNKNTITLPHPKKDLGIGLVRHIYKQAGWKFD